MTPQERYDVIQEAMQAFNPFYRDVAGAVFAEYDIQGRDWFNAYLARGLEPQPLTVDLLHQMTPYTRRGAQAAWLREAAEHGFLQSAGEESYRLTAEGRAPVEAFFKAAHTAIAPLEPLPEKEMARLAELLARVIAASEEGNAPAVKMQMRISRHTDPGPAAVPAVRIDQYLTDLLRLREDAHLAAWTGLDVDGRTWDTLTAVWREEDISADSLAESLVNRQFGVDDYAASLAKLIELGWVLQENGPYRLTETGRSIREEAEEVTNRLFFAGWSSLTGEERAELDELLQVLRDRLREMAADKATSDNARANILAVELSAAIFKLTRPAMATLMAELGLDQPGLGYTLIEAACFQPEPLSVDRLRRRSPYTASKFWRARLDKLAARDLLVANGSGTFHLTDGGKSALIRILDTFRYYLETVEVIDGVERLAALLGRVVDACLDAPDPPGTWCIRHSHNIAPDEDATPLAKIDQYLDDLNAFRDDAHLASFAPYDVDGHTWEFFSQIWRDEVHTTAEMAEKHAFRGYDEADYAAALSELQARGWVFVDRAGAARLTEKGRAVRETAETQTDRYFFLPWLALNQVESDELQALMAAAKAELEALAEPAPSPA